MSEEMNLDEIIDLRFSAIEHELFAIEQLRLSIEGRLPVVLETERVRMHKEISEEYAGEQWEVIESFQRWVDEFIDYELPRLYRYPVLMSLWAVFESATNDIQPKITVNGCKVALLKTRALSRFTLMRRLNQKNRIAAALVP